ncbi:ABC transporter permease [Cryobacterium sp. TMT3-29-2]|uniref:ABC transporter permease n=1 Tax=Cryobacterium sp. TMT3-29-2 TaxID=2555867 RepID=UPI001073DD96|nr:ABC transporter permease subunit [Cryobacterium sp. TMT3-29-2]TFC84262.1 ABC transporter permease subunit [Cryobacterium sp. TMT3-29-2]
MTLSRRSFGWGGLAVALPGLAVLAWFLVRPLSGLVVDSLHLTSLGVRSPGLTLVNYQTIATDAALRSSMVTTVVLALVVTVITLLICTPTALTLARSGPRLSAIIDAVLVFPLALPGIVIGFFVIVLLGRNGLVSQIVEATTGEPGGRWAYTAGGLAAAYVYFCIPRVVGTLRGAAATLDGELRNVAASLGAYPARVAATVTLPLLRAPLLASAGVCMATCLGAYGTAATLSEGIRVLPLDVADTLYNTGNQGLAAALSVVLALLAVGSLAVCSFGAWLIDRRNRDRATPLSLIPTAPVMGTSQESAAPVRAASEADR